MTPRRMNLVIATYPYGGNGAIASSYPDVGRWIGQTIAKAEKDERIGWVKELQYVDTPIPMVRNKTILDARSLGADLILMLDSDTIPDCEIGEDKDALPFWETAFNECYSHWEKGPLCIAAAYCGPSPISCVYGFHHSSWNNAGEVNQPDISIEMYSRAHAEIMSGIQDAAAAATGCMLIDIRCFDLTDPKHEYQRLLKEYGSPKIAESLTSPWFYYEWTDIYNATKASTEDVTFSRNLAMASQEKLGYCCVKIAWQCWAAHVKQQIIRKPRSIKQDQVNEKYRTAVLENRKSNEQIIHFQRPQRINFDELVMHGNGHAVAVG